MTTTRKATTLPAPTVCHWMEGTFSLPNADGKMEPWTGRVFIAVCAGGIQDPDSCYCADYTPTVRTKIHNLRAEIEALRDESALVESLRSEVRWAHRQNYRLKKQIEALVTKLAERL